MVIIGYFGGIDPAACLLRNGVIESYVEEERLLRYKHAPNIFPIRSIDFCLKQAGLELEDVDCIAYGWDIPRYTDGRMGAFYQRVNAKHAPDPATLSWQSRLLSGFKEGNFRERLRREVVPFFGTNEVPPLRFFPHHAAHAATAYYMSPYDDALIVNIDGSGDSQCATVWLGTGDRMELIHEVEIPDSLGWFYAAITEYLGFQAYDGEYKVMGLAAYGQPHREFREALERVVPVADDGWSYHVRPEFIHHGPHTYSDRFTDHLVSLLGLPPRQGRTPLEPIHEALAFEAQRVLEDRVLRLVRHFQMATGRKRLCLAGGVALNVKMNSRLRQSGLFDDVFVFPIPSDSGTAIGAALGVYHELTGKRPQPLEHVYLGPAFTDEDIELQLESCGLAYRRVRRHRRRHRRSVEPRQGGRLVPGAHGGGTEGAGRAIDPGRPAFGRQPRSRERGDQVPGVLAAVLSEHARGRGAAVHARRHAGSLHDHGVRGHRTRLRRHARRSFTSMAPCACRR